MPRAANRPPRRASRPRIGRVLVVEDDVVLALALEDALEQAGAVVTICPSADCTIIALEEAMADAVVLDVHLADRDDGWVLAEMIQQLGPRRPRVVFSTGSPEAIPPHIAELGMVFEKPYDPAQLVAELARGTRQGLFSRLRHAIS